MTNMEISAAQPFHITFEIDYDEDKVTSFAIVFHCPQSKVFS